MIQFEETSLRAFSLHRVATEENQSVVSNNVFNCDEETETLLNKHLLKPFSSHAETFEFTHEIDLAYNVLFNLAKQVFDGADVANCFENVVKHLINVSKHPKIKDGDLVVALFDNVLFHNKHYSALGVFKFEDKDSFLETIIEEQNVSFTFRKVIGNKKADKACLVLCTEEPYTLLITDSHSNETDYWQKEFINQRSKNDFVNNTKDFLTLTKSYITEQVQNEFEVSKADQIDFLNRSVDYFKNNETFVQEAFEEAVFGDDKVIASFRNFDNQYRAEHELSFEDTFEISQQAVKKQARVFKSVLKLDKNFHIYIHGNRELIEHGTDSDGRKYYKIYYEEES